MEIKTRTKKEIKNVHIGTLKRSLTQELSGIKSLFLQGKNFIQKKLTNDKFNFIQTERNQRSQNEQIEKSARATTQSNEIKQENKFKISIDEEDHSKDNNINIQNMEEDEYEEEEKDDKDDRGDNVDKCEKNEKPQNNKIIKNEFLFKENQNNQDQSNIILDNKVNSLIKHKVEEAKTPKKANAQDDNLKINQIINTSNLKISIYPFCKITKNSFISIFSLNNELEYQNLFCTLIDNNLYYLTDVINSKDQSQKKIESINFLNDLNRIIIFVCVKLIFIYI